MTDLVVASLEPWDAVWRRNQHLISGLLRRDSDLRVLFLEPDTDPLDALRRRRGLRRGRGLRPGPQLLGVGDGRLWLLEVTKWLPRRLVPGWDTRWAGAAGRAAKRLGMFSPILWVNDPRGAEIMRITRWPTLYDVTDDWTLAERDSRVTARTVQHDKELLADAQEVVVCSAALATSKGANRSVTLVPNGVDTAAYGVVHPRPADLPTGPYALYVGTLHRDRLDVDLTIECARAIGGRGALVMIGPNALDPVDSRTLTHAGVVLLGSRPAPQVPAYLQHADVLVVPHVVTAFTESLDPIKAYEYAAAGRPVVATPVPGFQARSNVTVATGGPFVSAVAGSLGGNAGAPRPAAELAELDWGGRVEAMAAVLERMVIGL